MGIFSPSVSIARYRVNGRLEEPVYENLREGLRRFAISEIDDDVTEKTVGWTSFENPFSPDFGADEVIFGEQFAFSLRVDKKTIPAKVVQKQYDMELKKRLAETGRESLSAQEKKSIREHVINVLNLRIPATPAIYDLIWNHEDGEVWFFSAQKSANDELESLFLRSFHLSLIRLFPYTIARGSKKLPDEQKDLLLQITPTKFQGIP